MIYYITHLIVGLITEYQLWVLWTVVKCGKRVKIEGVTQARTLRQTQMGGGPASYIPAHTSSALAASFRI